MRAIQQQSQGGGFSCSLALGLAAGHQHCNVVAVEQYLIQVRHL